ncbi:MAG: carboxymuconolactone decarboxylase family protein [Phycisphaerae bacterium]
MNQRPSKKKKGRSAGAEEPCCAEPAAETCCSEGHAAGASAVGAGAEEMFKAFMKTAGAPGALDAATKQALQIALSVLARCGPCIRIQVEKARKMGFTQAEIDEAVWMAIAFGGAPVMMFYKEVMKT